MLKLDLDPKPRILRQFAFVAVVGVPLLAFLVLRLCGAWSWSHPAFLAAAGLGVLQLAIYLGGNPAPTRWLYVFLMVIAFPIGFVLSQVLMAVVFYFVITPMALIFRLSGRDVLGRSLAPDRTSYWRDHRAPRDSASYFKLY